VKRAYLSALREEQAESTRTRIVTAVAIVLARGVAELSVLAVAREAGVSVATVKRHFPNKSELVNGLARHVLQLQGTTPESPVFNVRNLKELEASWLEVFRRRAQLDPALRQAMAHPEMNRVRSETRELRLAANERVLAPLLAHLPPRERRRVRDLVVLLLSTATANAWETLIGSSPEEMVATVFWALQLVVGEDSRSPTNPRKGGQ